LRCYYTAFLVGLSPCRCSAPPHSYPLSLHDALPISSASSTIPPPRWAASPPPQFPRSGSTALPSRSTSATCSPGRAIITESRPRDRKSTRLNSSHDQISYAVFCLKKKKKTNIDLNHT